MTVTNFDTDFCQALEYHLSRTMANSADEKLRHYWCDGVQIPEDGQLTADNIAKTKRLITKCWFGKSGQDEYEMLINLSEKSLKSFLDNSRLENALPPDTNADWINIYSDQHRIELQLL